MPEKLNAMVESLRNGEGPCIVAAMWVGMALGVMAFFLAEADAPTPGEPDCPSPSAVEARLARLGVGDGPRPEISIAGGAMKVVLRGRNGAILGSREIPAPGSCADRATVAAVLVATWMGVWPVTDHAETPPDPPPAKPNSDLAPPISAPMVKPVRPSALSLGATLRAEYDGHALAPGLAIAAGWRLTDHWQGFLGLSATGERETGIGQGRAGYLRPAVEGGPAFGVGTGRVRAEVGVAGKVGLLVLRGKGLPVTRVSTRILPGIGAGMRLLVRGKTWSPFCMVGGTFWFGRQRAILDNDPASADLPRGDVQVGLGISWSPGGP